MEAINVIRTFLSPNQPRLDVEKLDFDPYQLMKRLQIKIAHEQPFFSSFVMSYPVVIMAPSHPLISTAATDGNSLFFNALFMKLLNEKSGINDAQAFVFVHEIMHIVFDSFGRRGSRDPKLWNVATDYAINMTLMEFGMDMPDTATVQKAIEKTKATIGEEHQEILGEFDELFGRSDEPYVGLYDSKYEGLSAEQIYEILKEEDDQRCKQHGGSGSGQGQPSGLNRNKQTLDTHVIEELSDEEQKEIARSARSATLQAAKQAERGGDGRGELPLGLSRLINDWVKPKVPWSNLIVAEFDSLRISDYSSQRVDARMFSGGITLPGIEYESSIRVAVIVDTSGSIGEDDLRKVLGEMYGIVNQFDAYEIDVISCDTAVYGHKYYDTETGEDILKYPFVGGGGTTFEPAMQWMKQKAIEDGEYDAVLFFTDGYGEGWCESHKDWVRKMIWIIVDGHSGSGAPSPSWGTTIYYDEYA